MRVALVATDAGPAACRIVGSRAWRLAGGMAALAAALAGDALEALAADDADVAAEERDFRLLPPLLPGARVWGVGLNWRTSASAHGAYPTIFSRTRQSLVGHGAPLILPAGSAQYDYEGELALVVGRPGRDIAEESALQHIGAVTLCNDGTARDWLRHAPGSILPGKNFDGSGSLGPWLAPPPPAWPVTFSTHVNGAPRQAGSTAEMVFPPAAILAYLSRFTGLRTGDVILLGTPPGAGASLRPPLFLAPGDVVEIDSPAVGTLRNFVAGP